MPQCLGIKSSAIPICKCRNLQVYPSARLSRFAFLLRIAIRMLERRLTFACGDYVQYQGDLIGRIDRIFVHEISRGQKRLFAILTKCSAHPQQNLDPSFESPLLQLSDDTIIVGLPAISGQKIYVLPLKDKDLIFVDWQIQLRGGFFSIFAAIPNILSRVTSSSGCRMPSIWQLSSWRQC